MIICDLCGKLKECLPKENTISASNAGIRSPGIPATGFLERLASELKIGRHAAYRHAVQRALETVTKNYVSGECHSTTEAEVMLRELVEADDDCK